MSKHGIRSTPISFSTWADLGAVALLLFYFEAQGMEQSIEAADVQSLTQALVSTWEDWVGAALDAEFGEREGRSLFERYVTTETRSGLYRESTPLERGGGVVGSALA